MADFDPAIGTQLTNPVTGAQLAAWLNDFIAFGLSSGYGSATPANAEAGLIWAKNTGGTPEAYIHDGTGDVLLFSLANILGTVSANGSGANTGAVLEVGFTSGTLWAKFAGGLAVFAAFLNNHPAGTETWTLPFACTDTAKMFTVGTCQNLVNERIVSLIPNSTTTVNVDVKAPGGAAANSAIRAICIGTWTEEFL